MRVSRREFAKTAAAALVAPAISASSAACLCDGANEKPHAGAIPPKKAGPGQMGKPLNPLRLRDGDLRNYIRCGVDHIYRGAIDDRQGWLPFSGFNLTGSAAGAHHGVGGCPHVVGRFLDALAQSSEIVAIPPDEEADNGLRILLHNSLHNPWGFAFDLWPGTDGRRFAMMHDCREVLLGLVGLIRWKRCRRSAALAKQFIRTIDAATRGTGMFPSSYLYTNGWGKPGESQINSTTGRLVGALVQYYRATNDNLAVDLAKRFAEINIKKTFTAEGDLTALAGHHLHSTEGTMTGLMDLAVLTGEKQYFELGKRLYDGGLRRWRTSFGWAKEGRDLNQGRGEANNTGDFIEAALILGLDGHGEYFRDAECMIRNGLLAAQIINTDWIPQSAMKDTDECVYSHIRRRAEGAFAFTMPNSYAAYNTDLMGGALQSLCNAYRAIATSRDGACRVNMLFSADFDYLRIRSHLPESGRVEIESKAACDLSVRVPHWADPTTLRLHVNAQARPIHLETGQLAIGPVPKATRIEIVFEQAHYRTQEFAPGFATPYEISWVGDTIVSMTPIDRGGIPLY